jgi:ribose/xylose/arabinose/galactoside ABC-type transport system permease subunit
MTAAAGTPPRATSSRRLRAALANSAAAPVYLVLLALFVISGVLVTVFTGGSYFTVDVVTSILVRAVALGLVAAGQTIVIMAGSLDLSVAYTVSVTAVMASYIMQGQASMMGISTIVVLVIGAGIGLANGIIITKLHVNPFITTLGVGLMLRGVLNAAFHNFAGSVPPDFQTLGYAFLGPIPLSVILLGLVFGAGWFVLRSTRFGLHVFAVGGSEEVSRLSGVRSDRVLIGAHVICGLTAVLAGIFLVSRLRAGAPWVGTDGAYDLESIAAVVLGGTALSGGKGTIMGTLAGVLILAVLDSVFNALQITGFAKDVLRGIILIAAVTFYVVRERRVAR